LPALDRTATVAPETEPRRRCGPSPTLLAAARELWHAAAHEGARSVVLVLDGLGLGAIERHQDALPHVASAWRDADEPLVRTCFPSTTVSCLPTLGRGVPPAVHGLVGHSFRVLDRAGRSTIVHPSHLDEAAPRLALGQSDGCDGPRAAVVMSGAVRGSCLAREAFPNAERALAADAGELASLAARLLESHELVFVYVAEADAAAHRHGLGSRPHTEALACADAVFGDLCRRLGRCTLTVLADHGMVPVERSLELERFVSRADLAAIAGEPRAAHLYAREGHAESLLESCLAIPGATVLTREDVVRRELLDGTPGREVSGRVGDVLVTFERAGAGLVWSDAPGQRAPAQHGGLSDAELLVPLMRLEL
jgi:hypothetical protein